MTRSAFSPDPAYEIPYLLGVYLGLNAVSDAGLVVDGLPCATVKADFIAGNHDLYSTLLSESGAHRVMCTGRPPINPDRTPEKQIAGIVESAANCGQFSVIVLTGLPFLKITGLDHEGLAAGIGGRAPIAVVPSDSMGGDWLDGYAAFLDALARALPPAPGRRIKRSVALVGCLVDRLEGDSAGNLEELRRLLGFAGLELVSAWPSGGSAAELSRAARAELIISLPYGRKAARTLARRFGARLVETGLPAGLAGTRRWLAAVIRAAGLKGGLPKVYLEEERRAAAAIAPALPALAHRRLLFCGDPVLFGAVAGFAEELALVPSLAVLDAAPRPLSLREKPDVLLYRPGVSQARSALEALPPRRRPALAVMNSFGVTEKLAGGAPYFELGFPSYGRHCLASEPWLGLAGARFLATRLLNCAAAGGAR